MGLMRGEGRGQLNSSREVRERIGAVRVAKAISCENGSDDRSMIAIPTHIIGIAGEFVAGNEPVRDGRRRTRHTAGENQEQKQSGCADTET